MEGQELGQGYTEPGLTHRSFAPKALAPRSLSGCMHGSS